MATISSSRSCRTWPKGLRVIFWLCVSGLIIGIGQTLYWLFVTHEFFPRLTFQGAYAAVALLLTVTCVVTGALSYRRAFVMTCLGTAALHVCITMYFNFEILGMFLDDVVAGRWQVLNPWAGRAFRTRFALSATLRCATTFCITS